MSDYLWDKAGEPDPEIERLEKTLGALRYHHRPLELPPNVKRDTRRTFTLPLAMAATLILALCAGVWLNILRRDTHNAESQATRNTVSPNDGKRQTAGGDAPRTTPTPLETHRATTSLTSTAARRRPVQTPRRSFAPQAEDGVRARSQTLAANDTRRRARQQEMREGEIAKERLLFALDITSHKLNFAQRRVQATTSQSPDSNQQNR